VDLTAVEVWSDGEQRVLEACGAGEYAIGKLDWAFKSAILEWDALKEETALGIIIRRLKMSRAAEGSARQIGEGTEISPHERAEVTENALMKAISISEHRVKVQSRYRQCRAKVLAHFGTCSSEHIAWSRNLAPKHSPKHSRNPGCIAVDHSAIGKHET
jgi:hypothetical protein